MRRFILFFASIVLAALGFSERAEALDREQVAKRIDPPYRLGESIGDRSWELINLDGRLAGYAFETEPLAPLPGFSGAPINLLVSVTTDGKFIDVELVSHNEPIFVSGLGEAPFNRFVSQYRGLSITDSLVVGVPYGKKGSGSSLIYLEGVTKATASVRIAHETILGAAFAIAREKMAGLGVRHPSRPDPDHAEQLDWKALQDKGIAGHLVVTNRQADQAFKGSLWEDDDPRAKEAPDEAFLDLWVLDIGPPSVAEAVLSPEGMESLRQFSEIAPNDEPILLIENGRHGLVTGDFVRNTSPDLISLSQNGLPIQLRDADLLFELKSGIEAQTAMIVRTDRRLGFDPQEPWTLSVRAVREHGFFRPEPGTRDFTLEDQTPSRFFVSDAPQVMETPWQQALHQRWADLAVLSGFLAVLLAGLFLRQKEIAGAAYFGAARLAVLVFVVGFVGWWGQGQLSIVTVLGVLRGLIEGRNLAFLLYDPFSLLIWAAAIVSFVVWGRGLFCGWLCPFGAMQEIVSALAQKAGVKPVRIPEHIDRVLINAKYAVLAGVIWVAFFAPEWEGTVIEIEPFKTAVTTFFVRDWYFVAYAVALLSVSAFVFKAFCRYLCPLGAVMAIGGLLRGRNWIERRKECGSPCQLCRVRCQYKAISPKGEIRYDECFACLDCVTIYQDLKTCVPLVLEAKGRPL